MSAEGAVRDMEASKRQGPPEGRQEMPRVNDYRLEPYGNKSQLVVSATLACAGAAAPAGGVPQQCDHDGNGV